ncbi:hypothetical protein [Pseudomonas silesiensis]|uniref:hypothetical protein n=1 Tax=Pseudomonas silesiensis TaxID=1853130 RepID=UPI0034D56967
MTRETTKQDLLYYLDDVRVLVIALKGLWGTGKTHLWEEVKGEFAPINGSDHLYASCFGLESVEQIKAALFQNSLGKAEGAISAAKKFSGFAIDVMEKIAAKVVPGAEGAATVLGNIGGLVQSALIDKVLYARLIVLDDIERRGDDLRIDALLGFIDLLKRNGCKILLILNEEPIEQKLASDWRTLKEKCLDREIALLTSATEAAQMGLSVDVPFRSAVVETLVRLSVTNIRVVQRIDRVVSTVFDGVTDLHGAVEYTLLPAAVLMTALNFNAVPHGPDVESLMTEWSAWCANPSFFGGRAEEISDVVVFALNAKLTRDVEFLNLLRKHLLTGHRFKDAFDTLIQLRQEQATSNAAENAAVNYIEDSYLDPSMTDQDFIDRAKEHKEAWQALSVDKVSAIASDLERRGAPELAVEIANQWADRWRAAPQLWLSNLYPLDSLYSVIRSAIAEGNRQLSSRPSLLNAVLQVSSKSWGPDDTVAINEATVEELVDTILALDRKNFGTFIYFYRSEIKNPVVAAGEGPIFTSGIQTFLKAARLLVAGNTRPRLTELLQQHLGEHVLASTSPAHGESERSFIGTS